MAGGGTGTGASGSGESADAGKRLETQIGQPKVPGNSKLRKQGVIEAYGGPTPDSNSSIKPREGDNSNPASSSTTQPKSAEQQQRATSKDEAKSLESTASQAGQPAQDAKAASTQPNGESQLSQREQHATKVPPMPTDGISLNDGKTKEPTSKADAAAAQQAQRTQPEQSSISLQAGKSSEGQPPQALAKAEGQSSQLSQRGLNQPEASGQPPTDKQPPASPTGISKSFESQAALAAPPALKGQLAYQAGDAQATTQHDNVGRSPAPAQDKSASEMHPLEINQRAGQRSADMLAGAEKLQSQLQHGQSVDQRSLGADKAPRLDSAGKPGDETHIQSNNKGSFDPSDHLPQRRHDTNDEASNHKNNDTGITRKDIQSKTGDHNESGGKPGGIFLPPLPSFLGGDRGAGKAETGKTDKGDRTNKGDDSRIQDRIQDKRISPEFQAKIQSMENAPEAKKQLVKILDDFQTGKFIPLGSKGEALLALFQQLDNKGSKNNNSNDTKSNDTNSKDNKSSDRPGGSKSKDNNSDDKIQILKDRLTDIAKNPSAYTKFNAEEQKLITKIFQIMLELVKSGNKSTISSADKQQGKPSDKPAVNGEKQQETRRTDKPNLAQDNKGQTRPTDKQNIAQSDTTKTRPTDKQSIAQSDTTKTRPTDKQNSAQNDKTQIRPTGGDKGQTRPTDKTNLVQIDKGQTRPTDKQNLVLGDKQQTGQTRPIADQTHRTDKNAERQPEKGAPRPGEKEPGSPMQKPLNPAGEKGIQDSTVHAPLVPGSVRRLQTDGLPNKNDKNGPKSEEVRKVMDRMQSQARSVSLGQIPADKQKPDSKEKLGILAEESADQPDDSTSAQLDLEDHAVDPAPFLANSFQKRKADDTYEKQESLDSDEENKDQARVQGRQPYLVKYGDTCIKIASKLLHSEALGELIFLINRPDDKGNGILQEKYDGDLELPVASLILIPGDDDIAEFNVKHDAHSKLELQGLTKEAPLQNAVHHYGQIRTRLNSLSYKKPNKDILPADSSQSTTASPIDEQEHTVIQSPARRQDEQENTLTQQIQTYSSTRAAMVRRSIRKPAASDQHNEQFREPPICQSIQPPTAPVPQSIKKAETLNSTTRIVEYGSIEDERGISVCLEIRIGTVYHPVLQYQIRQAEYEVHSYRNAGSHRSQRKDLKHQQSNKLAWNDIHLNWRKMLQNYAK